MKKYSIFLDIKGDQIKIIIRFHLSPVQLALIKKTNKKYRKNAGTKKLSYTVCGDVN
jgi:hypothetical protein